MTENTPLDNSKISFLPKVLWDEHYLVVSPGLVMALSDSVTNASSALVDALLLQQMHYWMGKSGGTVIEGVKWFYFTYEEWQLQFPFFSISTIRRAITGLRARNLVLVKRLSNKNYNQVNWYTVNYEAVKALWLEKFSEWTPLKNRQEYFKPAPLNQGLVPDNTCASKKTRLGFAETFEQLKSSFTVNQSEQLKKLPYSDFLRSDYWQTVRNYLMSNRGYKCEICSSKKNLQVHHKSYANRGQEHLHLEDLAVLCAGCHIKAHTSGGDA